MHTKSTQPEWHVVYTMSRAEKKVATRISNMGLESYLPLHKITKLWSDRVKKLEVPLFPNYVFVKVDQLSRYSLMSIKGIINFVTLEKKPVILDEREIVSIKVVLSHNVPIAVEENFVEGMCVRINHGPFAGLDGVIVKKGSNTRLVVKMIQLEKTLSINVAPEMLEEISHNLN